MSAVRQCEIVDCGNAAASDALPLRCYEHAPGRKDDSDKLRWDLLPWLGARAVVAVLTYGARKYSPGNWRRVSEPRDRYFAAAQRHVTAWWGGEKVDPESGELHLAHAICCLLFLLELDA